MSSSTGSGRKWLRWLPGVIISALAIFAVIHFSKIQDVGTALRSVRLSFLLWIAFLAVFSLVIRGFAWRAILGNRVDFPTAFFGVSEGYFLNNILPFRAGEIGRSLSVGKTSGLGTFHVLSTVVIERAIDILFAAALLLFTLPSVIGADWIKPVAYSALGLVVLGLLSLFLVANNREKVSGWMRTRQVREGFFKKRILPQIEKILDGMSLFTHPSQLLLCFLLIGFSWLIWSILYRSAAAQLVLDAPLWWGAFTGSLLALGVAIPSAPAALGVFEASFVGALAILGIPAGTTLVYAIILHVNQVFFSLVFGLWGLIRDGRRISQILQVASASQPAQVDLSEVVK